MPLPTPKKDEKRSEFVGRCVKSLMDSKETTNNKQAVAICYKQWGKSRSDILDKAESYLLAEQALADAKLNSTGSGHASSLISDGKVTLTGSWSFDAADSDKLIKNGGLNKWMLAKKTDNPDPKKKSDWGFPFSNDGVNVNYHGVVAAKQRAAQQGYSDIEKAADKLMTKIKNKYPDKFKE